MKLKPELFKLHAEVEAEHWWFVGRRRILLRVLAAVLPPARGSVVVDVGCGTGANIAALHGAYECLGIDTTADAIELARQRFPEVEFVCGRAPEDLGPIAARVDAFLLMDVLEHVPDDAALLRPLVDVLRPGGLILITVPADMRLWSEHDESFGHYRRYDTASLRRIWAHMPVEEVIVSYFNTRLYPIIRVIRSFSRWRGRAVGRAGSDLSVPAGPVNRLLERGFAGEANRLAALAAGRRSAGYERGVSLIAVLRRTGSGEGRAAGP